MKKLLIVAAFIEALTGLLLFVNPRIVVQFLLGAQITGVGALMSRVAGISLIALGVACFPASNLNAFYGMLTYNALVIVFLIFIGIRYEAGILLWPAVVVHSVLSLLLVWAGRTERKPSHFN